MELKGDVLDEFSNGILDEREEVILIRAKSPTSLMIVSMPQHLSGLEVFPLVFSRPTVGPMYSTSTNVVSALL
jgi:hypothetical protein